MSYYTQMGERPDLASIDIGIVDGIIGDKLYPTVPVMDKSGTVYYMAVASVADAAPQTGRSAGTAPTGTQIATSSTTYTAAEAIKRGSVTPDEAKAMGGIEKADFVGAKYAKRSVVRGRELAIATQCLTGSAAATFDPAKFNLQVQTQLDALQLYPGRKALVGAKNVLKRICVQMLGDQKIGPMFARIATGTSSLEAAKGLNFEAWRQALALFLGVDDVLAGDSDRWNDSQSAGVQNRAVVTVIDDSNDELSHKYNPVLGKVFQYLPDGVQPFEIQSVPDRLNINNHYDAKQWYNIVEFNAGARKIIDGIAP